MIKTQIMKLILCLVILFWHVHDKGHEALCRQGFYDFLAIEDIKRN